MTGAEAILALTLNLFFEARGEGYHGMQAVADVTVTRVKDDRYPDNVVDVVLQPYQFSWTVDKLSDNNLFELMELQRYVLHSGKYNEQEIDAYRVAEKIARKVLQNDYRVRYRFTHYHATSVTPYWADSHKGYWIGNHLFYRI